MVKLSLLRNKPQKIFQDSEEDLPFKKYHFMLPLGCEINDIGLSIDICCGILDSNISSIIVLINNILPESLFAIVKFIIYRLNQFCQKRV